MVQRASRYYRNPFRDSAVSLRGDQFSPGYPILWWTWLSATRLVWWRITRQALTASGTRWRSRRVFNPDNGILAYTNPVCLQWVFDMLSRLFERVGLMTNTENIVTVMCQPGPIPGRQSAPAYGQQMTGKGDLHNARRRRRVVCGGCLADLFVASMDAHIQMQHGRSGWSMPLPPP